MGMGLSSPLKPRESNPLDEGYSTFSLIPLARFLLSTRERGLVDRVYVMIDYGIQRSIYDDTGSAVSCVGDSRE